MACYSIKLTPISVYDGKSQSILIQSTPCRFGQCLNSSSLFMVERLPQTGGQTKGGNVSTGGVRKAYHCYRGVLHATMTQRLLWGILQYKGIKAELLRAIGAEEPTPVLIDSTQ